MPNELKPPTERIPTKTWARTPKLVRVEMVALVQELAEVKQRPAKAEEQLRRNSQNSSQPPSFFNIGLQGAIGGQRCLYARA